MNKKLIMGIAAIGVALLIVYTGLPLLLGNQISVKQLEQNPQEYMNEKIDVSGVIKEDSVSLTEDGTMFVLKDKSNPNHQIQAFYSTSDKPTKNDEGKTVEVTGKLVSENQFEVTSITIGCKNTYQ